MQEKTVKIGNQEVKLQTSAYTPIRYAELFNENLFQELQDIISFAQLTGAVPPEKIVTIYRLAYCMAEGANPDIEPMDQWLRKFGVYDILEVLESIIDLWSDENNQQSTP